MALGGSLTIWYKDTINEDEDMIQRYQLYLFGRDATEIYEKTWRLKLSIIIIQKCQACKPLCNNFNVSYD